MNITEGNKLIAEFVGYTYFPYPNDNPGWKITKYNKPTKLGELGGYLCRKHNELRYDRDWNWLMKVIEKIESIYHEYFGGWKVHIKLNQCTIEGTRLKTDGNFTIPIYTMEYHGKSKIEAVWKAILSFIEFYKTINNDNN